MYARSAYEANTPQLFLNIDREKAQSMHVPVSRIFTTLQSKLASMYINDFNLIGYTFKVKMQSAAEDRTTINDIMNTYIQNDQGQMVPLSSVATLSYMVGPRQISRFNQLMSAEVTAQAKPGVSSGELMNQIEAIPLPENYSITWTDMSYQERQNDGKIVLLMGMALLFGYLFLVAQYESWTVPISVIVSVSVALLGALLGLIICNTPLSIYAQLGLVMLVGLAGKNAILMVEFSKMERERGVPIQEAALEGARQRFRAVMMTAISFIIGVFPMVIASGAGAASRKAIGISTFYGMILATVVGILFIPALYAMFQRMGERPVCQKGGINVKENCSMKDGAALAAPSFSFLCFSTSRGVTDKSGYLTCSYKYRSKSSKCSFRTARSSRFSNGGRKVSAGYSPFTLETHMRDMAGIIREKISAPPITMISGSINSRHSNSPAE